MIHFLLTRDHAYTISTYLASSGRALADRIRARPYDDVFRRRSLPHGTYVLTDFDRLAPARLRHVDRIAEALDTHGMRRLNRPQGWLSRLGLLQRLAEAGLNPYRGFRLDELPDDVRFPVFVRVENDHQGARSDLLANRAQIEAVAKRLGRRGKRRRDLIVVEFCDTADARGRYRKYAAFCVEGQVIPRHLLFGPKWSLKHPLMYGEDELNEEWAYVQANPHADQIRAVFELAGIDYGRIDYAVSGDRIRVFEINTNPMIAIADELKEGIRAQTSQLFADWIQAAFVAIDSEPGEPVGLPRLRLTTKERGAAVADRLARWLRRP